MEAEETVMGKVQRDNIFYRGIGTLEGVCKMQAEISFKAGAQLSLEKQGEAYLEGKQTGIREVVEWVDQWYDKDGYTLGETLYIGLDEWQAFKKNLQRELKGWGIKED